MSLKSIYVLVFDGPGQEAVTGGDFENASEQAWSPNRGLGGNFIEFLRAHDCYHKIGTS